MENRENSPFLTQFQLPLRLCWIVACCGLLIVPQPVLAQETGSEFGSKLAPRRATPDPYFQPRIQEDEERKSSNPEKPTLPIWEPPPLDASSQHQAPIAKMPNPKPLWEPPRTPVTPMVSPTELSNSIIRSIEQPNQTDRVALLPGDAQKAKNYSADLTGLRPSMGNVGSNSNSAQSSSPFQVLDGGQKIINPHSPSEDPVLPIPTQTQLAAEQSELNQDTKHRSASSSNSDADASQFFLPAATEKTSENASKPVIDAGLNLIDNNDVKSNPNDLQKNNQAKPAGQSSPSTSSTQPTQGDTRDEILGRPFEPTQLLAKVGNEPIFMGDILYEVNQLFDQFMPNAPQEIKNREMKKVIPNLLNKHVESTLLFVDTLNKLPDQVDIEKVLEQAGKEFDENAIKEMMAKMSARSPSELDAILRMQGTSLRKVRLSWAKEQITRFFLFQQISETGEVTHQQLLDEYNANRQQYFVPAKARWEEVMVRFSRTNSRAEAEQTIVEMGNKILNGANFGAVAKKSSHGYTADEGGVHKWTTKGALVHEALDTAIFETPIGELSEIIKTSDGYHIIRVLERVESHHRSFADVQAEIKDRLTEKRRQKLFEEYLNRVKDEIEVEYFYVHEEE